MKITEMPLWLTLNGHRNFMNFSLFSKFQTIENYNFRTRMSTVFSPWAQQMHMIFPLKSLKEFIVNAPAEKRVFPESLLKPNEIATS